METLPLNYFCEYVNKNKITASRTPEHFPDFYFVSRISVATKLSSVILYGFSSWLKTTSAASPSQLSLLGFEPFTNSCIKQYDVATCCC